MILKNFGPQGWSRSNIHIHYHNIQRSSSLKQLGQSKPNFISSIYGKGEPMCLQVIQVKMAAMPIYGKNPSKVFYSRTGGFISTKLGM